uniref:Coiled-coil domain containing 126 n=1 Tax=Equus asinus TaxID=9793 RepID=A0A8C4MUW4_EQUAS
MIFTISRKNMSQKLSLLLLVFGLIWGLMLLHYTFQQPRHQSSVKLREQILDLSKRYVKALAEENKNTVDVENGASMAGYVRSIPLFSLIPGVTIPGPFKGGLLWRKCNCFLVFLFFSFAELTTANLPLFLLEEYWP